MRIAVGKAMGFVIGIVGFVFLTVYLPESGTMMRWGILLWYATLGGVIGLVGVFTRHPVLMLPMPWWVRAPAVGAWMNFVLTFFAHREMSAVMTAMFGVDGTLSSPFWFVAEGAIVGALIGFFATRFGGEGRETVDA